MYSRAGAELPTRLLAPVSPPLSHHHELDWRDSSIDQMSPLWQYQRRCVPVSATRGRRASRSRRLEWSDFGLQHLWFCDRRTLASAGGRFRKRADMRRLLCAVQGAGQRVFDSGSPGKNHRSRPSGQSHSASQGFYSGKREIEANRITKMKRICPNGASMDAGGGSAINRVPRG